MPKPILVPLNTSIFASNALPFARVLARQSGASVHLARMREPIPRTDESPILLPHLHRTQRVQETWERHLEDVGRYFFADLGSHGVRTAVLEGTHLIDTLAAYAEEHGVGVVVMGTNGLRSDGYSRGLNMAAELGRESELPVLLIHPELDTTGYTRDRRFSRVLIALSGTELDEELVAATDLVDSRGPLHCTLVHVLTPSAKQLPKGSESADAYLKEHAAALKTLGHTAETRVIQSHNLTEAIIASARRVDAELIIAGSLRRSGASRSGFGSVTTRLFREAALPVLLVASPPMSRAVNAAIAMSSGIATLANEG